MEVSEFALIFTILVIYLTLSIAFFVQPRTVFFTPFPLLSRLSMVAFRPGSETRFELYIPEGISIIMEEDRIVLEGADYNPALIKSLMVTGLIKRLKGRTLYLNIRFPHPVILEGGFVYYLKLRSLNMELVEVEVLRQSAS